MNIPRYVIFGASHTIELKTRAEIDAKVVEKDARYKASGRMPSKKFVRTFDSIPDEDKFIMPIHKYTSSLSMLMLQAAVRNWNVAAVTTPSGKEYGDLHLEYLTKNCNYSLPKIVQEHSHPTLQGTIELGRRALDMPEKVAFVTSDLVTPDFPKLEQDFDSFDAKRYALWIDFNVLERIVKLFDRNAYHHMSERDFIGTIGKVVQDVYQAYQKLGFKAAFAKTLHPGVELIPFKEGNIILLGANFEKTDIANFMYAQREAGGIQAMHLLRYAKKLLAKDIPHAKRTFTRLAVELPPMAAWMMLSRKTVVTTQGMEKLASALVNQPIKITMEHNDPFRIKDIDAWHDLMYYRAIFQEAKTLDTIFDKETADVIDGFNRFMREQPTSVKDRLPIVYNFEQYAEQRSRALNMQEYLGPNGFREITRADEKIVESVEFLKERKKKQAMTTAAV